MVSAIRTIPKLGVLALPFEGPGTPVVQRIGPIVSCVVSVAIQQSGASNHANAAFRPTLEITCH